MSAHSANTYDELHDWAEENGSGFLQAIAEAAFAANVRDYNLLRPMLLKLKENGHR